MITSIVAAIAISQREARRKKAEQEAELEAASKKSVLIVSGGTPGLATAFLLHQFGFTVTIVDERDEVDVDEEEAEVVVVPAMTVELMVKAGRLEPSEDIKKALDEAGSPENITYRRYKSSKQLATTSLSSSSTLLIPSDDLHELLCDFTQAEIHTNTKIVAFKDDPEDLDGPLPHGRPYALSERGEKFYADIIIACGRDGLGRKHVCKTADIEVPAAKDSGWSTYSGFVDKYPGVREGANTWVGEDSFCTGYTTEDEWIFELHYLTGAVDDFAKHLKSWAPEVREPIIMAGSGGTVAEVETAPKGADIEKPTTEKNATKDTSETKKSRPPASQSSEEEFEPSASTRTRTILPPPATMASRKSRKILLLGDEAMRFPPHTPQLPFAMIMEDAATLAVCLRKAASVPLALEIFSRLRASRIEDAFEMSVKRLKTMTDSAQAEELEAEEVRWDVEGDWWSFKADKVADEKFELVIEILTQELLGKQKAMLEAEAKRVEEEEAAKKKAAEEEAARQQEEDEEEETETETEGETEAEEEEQEADTQDVSSERPEAAPADAEGETNGLHGKQVEKQGDKASSETESRTAGNTVVDVEGRTAQNESKPLGKSTDNAKAAKASDTGIADADERNAAPEKEKSCDVDARASSKDEGKEQQGPMDQSCEDPATKSPVGTEVATVTLHTDQLSAEEAVVEQSTTEKTATKVPRDTQTSSLPVPQNSEEELETETEDESGVDTETAVEEPHAREDSSSSVPDRKFKRDSSVEQKSDISDASNEASVPHNKEEPKHNLRASEDQQEKNLETSNGTATDDMPADKVVPVRMPHFSRPFLPIPPQVHVKSRASEPPQREGLGKAHAATPPPASLKRAETETPVRRMIPIRPSGMLVHRAQSAQPAPMRQQSSEQAREVDKAVTGPNLAEFEEPDISMLTWQEPERQLPMNIAAAFGSPTLQEPDPELPFDIAAVLGPRSKSVPSHT